MTPEDIDSLLSSARKALNHSIAPYSGFKVGAAIMDSEGTVYSGCNIENPSVMLTICAERVALYKALSEGKRDFSAIAIVCSDGGECSPCGVCRQALHEYAPTLPVYLESQSGIRKYIISDLLPKPFVRSLA